MDKTTTVGDMDDPDKQEWYRFDDEKVSTVPREKIASLDGGGAPRRPLAPFCTRADDPVSVIMQERTTRRTSCCTHRRSSSSSGRFFFVT